MSAEIWPVLKAPILTADGEELGQVGEVIGQFFKVDVPMRRDYWLDCTDITTVEGDVPLIVLSFKKAELDAHKRKEPSLG